MSDKIDQLINSPTPEQMRNIEAALQKFRNGKPDASFIDMGELAKMNANNQTYPLLMPRHQAYQAAVLQSAMASQEPLSLLELTHLNKMAVSVRQNGKFNSVCTAWSEYIDRLRSGGTIEQAYAIDSIPGDTRDRGYSDFFKDGELTMAPRMIDGQLVSYDAVRESLLKTGPGNPGKTLLVQEQMMRDRSRLFEEQLLVHDAIDLVAREHDAVAVCPCEPPKQFLSVFPEYETSGTAASVQRLGGAWGELKTSIGKTFERVKKHRKNRGVGATRKAGSKRKRK